MTADQKRPVSSQNEKDLGISEITHCFGFCLHIHNAILKLDRYV